MILLLPLAVVGASCGRFWCRMDQPINNPFSQTTSAADSDESVRGAQSQLILTSPQGSEAHELEQDLSPASNVSAPSLLADRPERRDVHQAQNPATCLWATTDATTPVVTSAAGHTPTAPPISAQSTRQLFHRIAQEAEALRQRWNQELTATASDQPQTMAAEQGQPPRQPVVGFADSSPSARVGPPVSARRSSLPPADLQISTPLSRAGSTRKDEELEVFARMAVNDTAFTPKPFKGTESDSEKTEQWIDYFTTYTNFRQIQGNSKLQLFRLLMADQAADWLRSLDPAITANFDDLLRAFRRRYSLTDLDRWRKASSLWDREQKATESVDTYITDIQNAARVVPVTDQNLLRFAIIKGLKPAIRLHVLQTGAHTLDGVIQAARVAEAALSASAPTDDITKLTDQVSLLLARMEVKPTTVNTSASTEPETVRRVTFAPLHEPEESRRPPSPRQESPAGRSPSRGRVSSDFQRSPDRSSASRRWDNSPSRAAGQSRDNTPPRWSPPTNTAQFTRPRSQSWQQQPRENSHPGSFSSPRMPQRSGWSSSTPSNGNCSNCGRVHIFERRFCAAAQSNCYRCGRVGHFQRCCRSAPTFSINNSY